MSTRQGDDPADANLGVDHVPAADDPAARVLGSPAALEALADPEQAPGRVLDATHRVEHTVPLGDGRAVFVTETFTLRSWLRTPRRAAMLLPGYVTLGSAWNIAVPGYDGGARLAAEGFFAFAVDYAGFGRSSCPADGSELRPSDQVDPLRAVLEHIRDGRGVRQGVDIVAESVGSGIATMLATDTALVRSATLTTILYEGTSDTVRQMMLSSAHRRELDAWPDGYLVTDPAYYGAVTADSPPGVAEWIAATQPGRYPTGLFLGLFEGLPYFDPGAARAPGLVLVGARDVVPAPGEAAALARDYGPDGAVLVELEAAGHVPRFETRASADAYWTEVLGFIG